MTRDEWLIAHAYLRPVASLAERVEAALAGVELAPSSIPAWDAYAEDFGAGVPLLSSPAVAFDLEPAGRTAAALVRKLVGSGLPGALGEETGRLQAELQREIQNPRRIVDWLLGDDAFAPSSPGLLRYLGWSAVARGFAPLVRAFDGWRNDERWMHPICPLCGAAPAMAQLIGVDPGRKRFLSCGCCRTRWQFGRTRCPFCREDASRLSVVTVAGQAGLRIDSCESCKGYLKTLEGQKDEALLLSDWSSLHLDLLAHDRGLKRRALSLYDLEPLLSASAKPA
jgi:FdhE protein